MFTDQRVGFGFKDHESNHTSRVTCLDLRMRERVLSRSVELSVFTVSMPDLEKVLAVEQRSGERRDRARAGSGSSYTAVYSRSRKASAWTEQRPRAREQAGIKTGHALLPSSVRLTDSIHSSTTEQSETKNCTAISGTFDICSHQ